MTASNDLHSRQLSLPNHGEALIAVCHDTNGFQASMRGHGRVYPFAEVVFEGNFATFFRDGKEVWLCTERYAREHFSIIEKPALSEVIGGTGSMEGVA